MHWMLKGLKIKGTCKKNVILRFYDVQVSEFPFKSWGNKLTAFLFFFFLITILIFSYLMAKSQLKCGIINEKIIVQACDHEQIIQIIMNGLRYVYIHIYIYIYIYI